MIVSDTNLLIYLFVKGEYTQVAEEVLKTDDDWIVPSLWKHEFRNALATMVNNNRITTSSAFEIVDEATSRMVDQEFPVASRQVLELSRRSSLSSYDCEFVALALKVDTQLVTSDQEIIESFPTVAISPKQFLGA